MNLQNVGVLGRYNKMYPRTPHSPGARAAVAALASKLAKVLSTSRVTMRLSLKY